MKKFMLMTVAASALLATPHAYTMNPVANKTAGYYAKLIAKKATSGAFSTLHWAIAAEMSFNDGIQGVNLLLNEKKICEKLNSANEQVTNFVISEMEETNHKKIDGVKIAYMANDCPMGTCTKNILITPETATGIANALKTNDQKILNKWRAALQHEAVHIKKNDLLWRPIIDLTSPFVTHGSVKAIRSIIPVAKKVRSFWGEQFIKIPTAYGKNWITNSTRMAIYKTQEQRADDSVSNDIDTLNSLKDTLSYLEENRRQQLKILSPKQYKLVMWAHNFFEKHPLPTKRIEKLDQRIALLEKQSNNNS
jgi:hypothetical protein